MGLGATGAQNLGFPIDFDSRPYNSVTHYRAVHCDEHPVHITHTRVHITLHVGNMDTLMLIFKHLFISDFNTFLLLF